MNVRGPQAEAPAQAALRTSRWAGGPVLGWAATSGGRERGWQTEGLTPEPLPKACQGLEVLSHKTCGYSGGGVGGGGVPPRCLLAIGQVTTNTTLPAQSLPVFP